jgi:hypothetical protein
MKWSLSESQRTSLGAYSLLLGAFGLTFVGLHRLSRRSRLPVLGNRDLFLMAVATHKLTRILSHDRITKPLRAPFVNEIGGEEKSAGHGLRRALGELLTCQFCMGPWVASALLFSFNFAPMLTRRLVTVFSAVGASDFLHLLYQAERAHSSYLQKMEQQPTEVLNVPPTH